MKYIIFILLIMPFCVKAADLPAKGLDPPAIVMGPDRPPNPPVGNGLALVAGFAVLYVLKKRKT